MKYDDWITANALQLQKSGFFTSAGFHGCSAKMVWKQFLISENQLFYKFTVLQVKFVQLQRANESGSDEWNVSIDCLNKKQSFKNSYCSPQNVVLNVMTNADEMHALEFFAVPSGETAKFVVSFFILIFI